MQSFDAPTTGQQIEQMKSLHGNGVEVPRPVDPDSSEPTWLISFNAYSMNETFVTEFDTAKKYQHQQFNTTYEVTKLPAFKSVGHDATKSASFRIEGGGSKPTVNPSQAEDDPDKWLVSQTRYCLTRGKDSLKWDLKDHICRATILRIGE